MADEKDVTRKYSQAVLPQFDFIVIICKTYNGWSIQNEHLNGGRRNARGCTKVNEEIRKEAADFMEAKQKAEVADLNDFEEGDYDDNVVLMQPQASICGSTTSYLHKPPKTSQEFLNGS